MTSSAAVSRSDKSEVAPRIIRLPAVLQLTGLSRSTLYELDKAGAFPGKVRLSSRSVGWVEEEVRSFIRDRIAARDAEATGSASP